MQNGSRLFRLGLFWLTSTSLSLSGPITAMAQPAPEPGVANAQSGGGDPPGLAGRLTDLNGTVSYHPAGADQWSPASQNFPVTSGNAYWTEPQATATIEIGDDELVMDGGTELDVTTLDQSQFSASAPQGAIFLGLRDLPQGQALTVTTPRGAVQITQPGAYEIVAGDTNDATTVTVVTGAAHVTGNGVDLDVTARQTATINGADTFQGSLGAMAPDQFLTAQLAKFQPPRQSAPPEVAQQVRYMTGGSSLSQYGSWSQTANYGQVWYPSNVGSNWAPYRNGHWSYVQPWGWNWVDDEPWGFAPFHYGRWINDGGRWGWVAGGGEAYGGGYPVYAPALVSFVGFEPGVLGGVGFGLGVGFGIGVGVGWFPLGYREAYVPWYHCSDGYFQGVNRYSVANYRNININNYRNVTINNYHNARFATVAPGGAFARGERMEGIARPLPAAALARARPVVGRLPVAPNAGTRGLSRNVAAAYHVPVAARPAGGAGPHIRPGGFGEGRPALRQAAGPANARPVGAGASPRNEGAHSGIPAPGRGGQAGDIGHAPSGAPGPAITHPGAPGGRPGLPALRAARPEQAAPGVAHPGLAGRPEARPGLAGPGTASPGEAHPGQARPARGLTAPQAAEPARGAVPRAAGAGRAAPGPGAETRHATPAGTRPAAPTPVARPERAAHPAQAPHQMARPEQRPMARPEPRQVAPRPEPRQMAPRPEPRQAPPPRPAAPPRQAPPQAAPPHPGPEHRR